MKNPNEPKMPGAKDITCAVRFNATMYNRLKQTAKEKNLSLSDIIRQALTTYMEEHSKSLLEKKLEEEEAARLAAHPEKKCDNCGDPLPKKPFYALQFAYCKTECIREHKRKLQLARFG